MRFCVLGFVLAVLLAAALPSYDGPAPHQITFEKVK